MEGGDEKHQQATGPAKVEWTLVFSLFVLKKYIYVYCQVTKQYENSNIDQSVMGVRIYVNNLNSVKNK